MIGIIPAAGRGTRAYPYSKGIPKGMIDVAGRPNLERIVILMRDKLQIARIVIIVGAYGDRIRTHFGNGQAFGVDIIYIENDAVERGLGYSLLLAKPFIDDFCCVILSDECYVDSNHEELVTFDYRNYVATCGVQISDAPELIERNYAVFADGTRVLRLSEKPQRTAGALLGLGTFLLRRDFFDCLEAANRDSPAGASDPVSVIGRLCEAGTPVAAFGLDPVSWTSSERWIRCPDRWQTPRGAGPAGSLTMSSKPRLSAWSSMTARPFRPWRVTSI